MDRWYRKQTCWKAKSLRPKDTLAEVTFPPHNAAEYIEHAQLLAMDYPNMLTAVAVRNKEVTQLTARHTDKMRYKIIYLRVFVREILRITAYFHLNGHDNVNFLCWDDVVIFAAFQLLRHAKCSIRRHKVTTYLGSNN